MPALVADGKVARDGGPLVVHDQTHGGMWTTVSAHFPGSSAERLE